MIVTTLRGQVPSQNVYPAPITPCCLFRKDPHGMRPAETWVSLGWVLARGGSKHESHLSQLKQPVPGRKRERLLGGALRGKLLGWPQNTGAGKIGPFCSQSLEDKREQVDPENTGGIRAAFQPWPRDGLFFYFSFSSSSSVFLYLKQKPN